MKELPNNDLLHFRYLTSYDRTGRLLTAATLEKSTINVLKNTIVIIADLAGIDEAENYKFLINELFEKDNYNVFLITRNTNSEIKYKVSVDGMGNMVGDFLAALIKKTEPYITIHLVGYKSGTEIAGIAAKNVLSQTGVKISRITALSPLSDLSALKDGAKFVDVVHERDEKGAGDVDFYLEGDNSNSIDKFANSIRGTVKFVVISCDSWKDYNEGKCNDRETSIQFGYNVSLKAKGKYLVLEKSE